MDRYTPAIVDLPNPSRWSSRSRGTQALDVNAQRLAGGGEVIW